MTNISKCLAVFAMVACLAFLGVVAVSVVGGPNFEAQLSDPGLSGILFTRNTDQDTGKVTWKAQTRRHHLTDESNPNAPKVIANDAKVLPQVIIDARKFIETEQGMKEEQIDKEIAERTRMIAEAKRLKSIDVNAMEKRLEDLNKKLQAKHDALDGLAKLAVDAAAKAHKSRLESKRRREELERLRKQAEELIADRERLLVQKKKIEILLVPLQGNNERLQRRRQRLLKQGTNTGSNAKTVRANR